MGLFWFKLARVTAPWLDYISDPQSHVLPTDGTGPPEPDCFPQIYEYGPFHIYDQPHLMIVDI